jgi:NAD(P)-dependent dehydrogenase (short-subunit alcohol dehydrogenase family)
MVKASRGTSTAKPSADTATLQRKVQKQQDRADAVRPSAKAETKGPVQAGPRKQPEKMPAQHIRKPAHESELKLQPRYAAQDYEGSRKLLGKIALITGGDSGIGRAVAVLFAREGADVSIVYLDEHDDAEETRRLVEAEGRQCELIPGDVRDAAFCRDSVARTLQKFGELNILVNNAGFQEHVEKLEDLSEERFDLTLKTNVYGYFHMAKAALEHLKQGDCIINTGSVTGLEGEEHLLDYSTTKGAIHAFTKALARNVMNRGIRVNAIAPGPVWTPLNPADKPAAEVAKFGQETDMHRPAQPEELSPSYVFLASSICSGYITGIVLPVTGSVGAI